MERKRPLSRLTAIGGALVVAGFSLAACGAPPVDAPPRVSGVQASADETATPLTSPEAVATWSAAHRSVPVAFATPFSEGLVWTVAGLACPAAAFPGFAKVDLIGDEAARADMAMTLADHNRAIVAGGRNPDQCILTDPVATTNPVRRSENVVVRDLELPAGCESRGLAIPVSVGERMVGEPFAWLIDTPRALAARERRAPDLRAGAARVDGLRVHRDGGYLSSADFRIQCRDLALMGEARSFVRCQILDDQSPRVAGFDVPAPLAGCTGFVARAVSQRLGMSL